METKLEKDHVCITVLWCEEGGTEVKIYKDRCELWETPQYGGEERLERVFPLHQIKDAIEIAGTYT
jgi:hypothetical protein